MAMNASLRAFFQKSHSLVETAALIAVCMHAGQTRKDDGSPYIIHPCMVALELASHGCSDTVIAAGYTHDILEDTDMTKEELAEFLGEEVVQIVTSLTEDKTLAWEDRKKQYIETIRRSSDSSKFVSIADKIHNLQSMLSAYEKEGEHAWTYFNRGKKEQAWFHKSMLSMFEDSWSHPLVSEYAELVKRLEASV